MLGPTQDMTPDTNFISQGLLQLISHTLKKQNPKIQQQEILKINDYCSRILSSRFSYKIKDVETLIQKKLVTIPQNALRFGVIVQKLKDLKTIKNVNEILSFLVGISNQQKNVVDQSILKLGLSKLEFEKPVAVKEKLVEKASVFNHYYQKSSEITERDLIRELLFAFQGIDGQFIQFDTIKNQYVIDKQLELPKTTVQLISRLLRLGWVFRQIQTLLKDQKQGLYRQSFLSSVKDEVQEYYRLLAILESQLDKSDQQGFTSQQLSLKRLFVWTAEPMIKMRMLLSLLETCKNLKGGEIITAVQRYAQHGDPLVVELIQKLLKKLTVPFYAMVHDWIYNGELQDPFDEFFIAQNDDSEIENEWKSKFSLRQSMVPSYITPTLARKVFLIGKSLNFIRHSCNDADFPVFESQKQQLEYGDVKKLETSIDKAYRNSSKHLLSLILDTFQLRLHLHAIKKYILLSQGDFVQYLMDSLGPTLSKPATSIYRHNVTGTLESAIRSSNAQYDHPDVLKRLDVRLLDGNEGETGWDLFVLDFNPNPNNTILNQQAMHQYHRIFCFLWKIKRVEHCLSKSWQLQAQSKSRGKTVHQAQMVLGEMVHFINQLQRFVFYEVIECAWNDFMTVIDGDDSDLDTLIEAHETFLVKVMKKGLIDAKGTSDGISKIFNCVYKFSKVHSQFLEFDDGEMELLDTMQEFQNGLQRLFSALMVDKDEDVQFLATRWNFNHVYGSD